MSDNLTDQQFAQLCYLFDNRVGREEIEDEMLPRLRMLPQIEQVQSAVRMYMLAMDYLESAAEQIEEAYYLYDDEGNLQ
jgi:hypothetical protein